MTGPDPRDSRGPADDEHVRRLLGEVGRTPEPLPEDVATRLDDVLAGLVAERAGSRTVAPEPPAAIPLERARRRRRRATQLLTAAAAVVVVGYAGGQVLLQPGEGDASSAGGAAEDAAAPKAGGSSAGGSATGDAFPLSSGSLRTDARRLVASDSSGDLTELRTDRAPDPMSERLDQDDSVTRAPADTGADAGPQAGADAGLDSGLATLPKAQRADGRCVDPLVPRGLTRLSVTYDGAAATAVLRPGGGGDRVRVEVWDCATPRRVASVVVRR